MDKKKLGREEVKEAAAGQNFSAEDSASNLKFKKNLSSETDGSELQDSGSSV